MILNYTFQKCIDAKWHCCHTHTHPSLGMLRNIMTFWGNVLCVHIEVYTLWFTVQNMATKTFALICTFCFFLNRLENQPYNFSFNHFSLANSLVLAERRKTFALTSLFFFYCLVGWLFFVLSYCGRIFANYLIVH